MSDPAPTEGEDPVPADAPADNPYVVDPDTDFAPVEDLSHEDAAAQADALREAIRYHDYRYYVQADPLIADRTYDALLARLQDLEAAFDVATEDSPTRRVGGEPVDAFETVEHVAPMLSIDQSGDESEVRAFDDRVRGDLADADVDPADLRYVCEPKFDGVSIELVYEEGRLVRGVTRGDGHAGDDVTRNVRTIGAIPQRLRGASPEFLAVRGEVFMPRDAFQQYNKERVEGGDEPFANPRNATAGTLRQQDPSIVADRPLSCFVFEVLGSSDGWATRMDEHRALPDLGFRVNDRVERVDGIETAIDYRDRLLSARDDLDYEIDGAVIKVDDRAMRDALGATSRHYRWAFAYKFPPRTEETRLANIAIQIGRTGRATPVALLDPVDVGGVTVSRASLHNPEQIADLNVNVGDRVRIERAGDVIPQVVEVVEKHSEGHYTYPETCPVCDSVIERDGPEAFCTGGLGCRAQLTRSVVHYGSDSGLDIEGLGEKSVEQFVEAGLISEGVADLYRIDRADLVDLEGWGETSADNLLAELDAAREPPLADFLTALGIPEVGDTTARALARAFGTFEALRETARDGDREPLEAVPDVGPKVAETICDFFGSEANEAVIDDLLEHVSPQAADVEGGDELAGLTFVFTGSLDAMTRDDAEELVQRHGGSATGSVSGNTDYLVVGANPGTRKREDAEAEDVPQVDEAEFYAVLEERGVAVDGE